MSQKLKNTGERMVPEYNKGGLIYAEHIVRYKAAQELVKGKVVLDIASGSGYGSNLLSNTAKKVYGVELDESAVKYAKDNYGAKNIEFKAGSATDIPLPDNSVDVVVTFETIEHIENYEQFIKEMNRVLKPDGLAIVSTPNELEFAEGNHFHLHEFEYKELKDLLAKSFKNIESYFQATWKYVALADEKFFEDENEESVLTTSLASLPIKKRLYFYLLCSNRKITERIRPKAATGEHYSESTNIEINNKTAAGIQDLKSQLEKSRKHSENLEAIINSMQASRSYKLARSITRIKRLGKK